MLLRELIAESRTALSSLYPEEEARSIVSRLAGDVLGVESYTHVIDPGRTVQGESLEIFLAALSRLEKSEPLQYVLGYADFCRHRFHVTPDVLIPRPETEMLCMETIYEALVVQGQRAAASGCCASMREMSRLKVLDLCTGSGCISWTLAAGIPGSRVVGVDISDAALKVARSQSDTLQESGYSLSMELEAAGNMFPEFVKYDVLSGADGFCPDGLPAEYDIIVSNPPYVRESERSMMRRNVLEHEPELALFVPDDDPLKFYRIIAEFAFKRIIPGGFGIVEINEAFGDAVATIFASAGMSEITVIKDFGNQNRLVKFKKF
ncbi:MAG: peptide chain release factor N(5)-glutamine methyltransferase [Clostridium sp.]|nr:peptide chain release factor N(5)-glutamine methyltransferase [Bacteroides sp.]MCM1197903.1 peptide chain release factor N(5)-glutamine methyltransferase [Clostridium sp.]